MNLLIPGIFLVTGRAILLIDLVLIEKKSIMETLIMLQSGIPKKPLGIIANFIVVISGIVLLLAYLSAI